MRVVQEDKVHMHIYEYTITKDDVYCFVERVQDCAIEDFEEAKQQMGRIHNKLADIRQVLEQIQVAQR
jgi:hypothetical protein